MLTTYQRIIEQGKVTRRGTVTYDNRSQDELVKQLKATVDVLTARIRELERGTRVAPSVPERSEGTRGYEHTMEPTS